VHRPAFIARQSARPSGFLGRVLGAIMAKEMRALNDEVLRRMAVTPGERILEIGFGHGRTLERAIEANPEARFAGIDHADDMVDAMARRCRALVEAGRLELKVGDSQALPWADGSFQGVFAVHTLYFWRQAERDLLEIRRVLQHGGRLILGFRERSTEAEAAFPPEIYCFRSPEEVATLLSASGLTPSLSKGPHSSLWLAEARAA
jgi:ubiquinone/menaquinone biosynthesis C-methylase UbiE